MLLGLVGKPSSGKTTFFNAATEQSAKTAPYPFTTIEPNVGVTWVRTNCPHVEIGKPCNPNHGFCIDGERFVPVEIIDVAGLVPGAHEGRGLGNKFLDDLRQASVLIHVVDASGSSDAEGNPLKPGERDPAEDIEFLREEILAWFEGIVQKAWEKVKRMPNDQKDRELLEYFSGLGITREQTESILNKLGYPENNVREWAEHLLEFKPIIIAANKIDVDPAPENVKELQNKFDFVIPTSGIAEYTLRKAAKAGFIRYVPGDPDFEILKDLTPQQRQGLEYIRERVLEPFGSTGVQQVINTAVFDILGYKVVYPVEDENRWTDKKGNVLPDAFLLPKDATALDLAFKIHTEIGKKFIAAVDARTKKRIGKDHVLKDGDVIKIVAGR